jgi:hypothetical protein
LELSVKYEVGASLEARRERLDYEGDGKSYAQRNWEFLVPSGWPEEQVEKFTAEYWLRADDLTSRGLDVGFWHFNPIKSPPPGMLPPITSDGKLFAKDELLPWHPAHWPPDVRSKFVDEYWQRWCSAEMSDTIRAALDAANWRDTASPT